MVTEIILQHGWGFDSTAWNGWVPALERKANVIVGERGYYGLPESTPKFSQSATEKIVVAHSLGLHLIEPEVLAQADAVLLLGAFLHFHPSDEVGKKRSQRIISRMRIKLNLDEAAVVNEFWQNAYKPEFATNHLLPAPQIDTEALLRDLDLLDTSKMEPARLAGIAKVIVVQAGQDHIVNSRVQQELIDRVPHASVVQLPEVSHAFPLTNVEKCLLLFNYWIIGKHTETCTQ